MKRSHWNKEMIRRHKIWIDQNVLDEIQHRLLLDFRSIIAR
jgi:hypothetical protein